MSEPSSTVVVVPRETHSAWPEMLARLREHTDPSVPVVVVDGGSPRGVRRRLERLAVEAGFTLLRSERVLSSNEARNAAMRHVHTEFVAFLDNDTLVSPGWLPTLERCLRDTDGAVASAVVLSQRGTSWEIHDAGGTTHLVDDGTTRRLEERNAHMGEPESAVVLLRRAPTEFRELHCLLVRAAVIEEIGGFDERYLAGREYTDLSLRIAAAGYVGWVEPAVVVRFKGPRLRRPGDYALYLARWSDEWGRVSFAHFNEKWGLHEPNRDEWYFAGRFERRLNCPPKPPEGWRRSAWRVRRRFRRAVDLLVTPRVVRAHARDRATAAPPRATYVPPGRDARA